MERLLSAGVNVHLKDIRYEITAVEIALQKNLMEIAELLGHAQPLPTGPAETEKFDPLQDFLSELPDESGNGGFSNEIRFILSGVGLVNVYDKLNKKISLPDFLNITDVELFNIGVKFAPTRRKILLRGVHIYHLQPWKKSSMHQITSNDAVK